MEESYTFHYLASAVFSTLETRDLATNLSKWGLLPHMKLYKFRFNLPYNELSPNTFLLDLINDPEVSSIVDPIRAAKSSSKVSSISFNELKSQQTSMDYFNFLQENNLVTANGSIRKVMPEYLEDIEICDTIREALLMEESENFTLFDENYRNEFLFRIFQHIVIGGGMCQYDDEIGDYLEAVKSLYKDLVTVTKDSESGELKVVSKVYQILPEEGFKVFLNPHVQDFLYVIIDPSYRHVNLWYHKWTHIW